MRQVLIVDNDPIVRHFLCRMLEVIGYECKMAKDGAEALAGLRKSVPNLIVTDHEMPVMNGLELVEEVSRYPELKSIPIILLSDVHLCSGRKRARKLGVSCVLSKPLDFLTMRSAVSSILSRQHHRGDLPDQMSCFLGGNHWGGSSRLTGHLGAVASPPGGIIQMTQDGCRTLWSEF